MKKLIFEGTATAMVTPFNEKGIDFEAFSRQIDLQIEAKIPALVICGTTGEAPTLDDDEHLEAISFAVSKRYFFTELKSIFLPLIFRQR